VKITRRDLRQIIKEAMSNAPTEIFMDLMKRGGPDYWLSQAYGRPMKCRDPMHYDQALRAYIDEVNPSLQQMPNNHWNMITNLMEQAIG
jgi:hypothetical protein